NTAPNSGTADSLKDSANNGGGPEAATLPVGNSHASSKACRREIARHADKNQFLPALIVLASAGNNRRSILDRLKISVEKGNGNYIALVQNACLEGHKSL